MLFQIGLFLHIMGMLFIFGASIGNFVVQIIFWQNIDGSQSFRRKLLPLMIRFPMIIMASMMMQLISGLVMLAAVDWIFIGQRWFTFKIILYIVGFLNGILIAKPIGKKISQQVMSEIPDKTILATLKKKINLFHVIQYILLILLIIMAIFKF